MNKVREYSSRWVFLVGMYACTYVCKSRYFHLVREGKGREAECKGKGIGIGKGKGKRCWVGWLVGWLAGWL